MNTELYYLWQDEQQKGPFTIFQLRSMWNAGTITVETLFSTDATVWKALAELQAVLEPQPAPKETQPLYVTPFHYNKNGKLSGIGVAGVSFGFVLLVMAATIYFEPNGMKHGDEVHFLYLVVSGSFVCLGSWFWARK